MSPLHLQEDKVVDLELGTIVKEDDERLTKSAYVYVREPYYLGWVTREIEVRFFLRIRQVEVDNQLKSL
jgi:hypothetical protein